MKLPLMVPGTFWSPTVWSGTIGVIPAVDARLGILSTVE